MNANLVYQFEKVSLFSYLFH